MNYLVKTYEPTSIKQFQTIKDAKKFMIDYAFINDIDLGSLSIDTCTISFQITIENKPKIRFERSLIKFN